MTRQYEKAALAELANLARVVGETPMARLPEAVQLAFRRVHDASPLRTRQEVDADIVKVVRGCLGVVGHEQSQQLCRLLNEVVR